jgi:hypothetical protein
MKQASLHYFKVLQKCRRGRPLKNPVPLPIFAVLPKKTKATKEVRDIDTEDSGEENGGAEKDVEVEVDEVEVDEVGEVGEVDEVDYEVDDPKKKMPRVMLIVGCTCNNGRPTKSVRRSAVRTKT